YYLASGVAQFAVASDGTVFYVPRDSTEDTAQLVWLDRSGQNTPISPARRAFYQPKLSPDGKLILVSIEDMLSVFDIARQTWAPLAPVRGTGIWGPDSKFVAFSSNKNGGVNIFTMPVDGSTPPRQLTHTTRWPFASSWSPDGRELAIVEQFKDRLTDIYIVNAE